MVALLKVGFFILPNMRYKITYECADQNAPERIVNALPKPETFTSGKMMIECFNAIPRAENGVFIAKAYINGVKRKLKRTNF
jgi:hypothetical protein